MLAKMVEIHTFASFMTPRKTQLTASVPNLTHCSMLKVAPRSSIKHVDPSGHCACTLGGEPSVEYPSPSVHMLPPYAVAPMMFALQDYSPSAFHSVMSFRRHSRCLPGVLAKKFLRTTSSRAARFSTGASLFASTISVLKRSVPPC